MPWRRILTIIGLIVTAIVIAFVLYFVFFRPVVAPPVVPPPPPPPPVTGVLPPAELAPPAVAPPPVPPPPVVPPAPPPSEIAVGRETRTNFEIPVPVLQPQRSADKVGVNYYDIDAGQFYRLRPDGTLDLLSPRRFPAVQNVSWSPLQNQAVIEFPDGANVLYNFDTEEQVSLPAHWQDFNFSKTDNQLAFKSIGTDLENRWLAVSTPTGDRVQLLETLGNRGNRVIVDWSPNNQMVAMFTENLDADRSELFFVGLNGENFKSTTLEGQGFVGQWAPKGDKILYSVHSDRTGNRPELWVVDAFGNNIGANKKVIGLQTFADKCVIASDNTTAYCAAPIGLQAGAGIFRPAVRSTPDAFYKVNLQTGTFEGIAVPEFRITAENLVLTEDESRLYFSELSTGFLASIRLK